MGKIDLLSIFADDKSLIFYRPKLNKIIGKITSTILLQQIIYWYYKNDCKPFYKFKEPCSHRLYKKGDSWVEELSFTRHEFDTALNRIAIKVNKKEHLEHNKFVEYWTNTSRLTYYKINKKNLLTLISSVYVKTDSSFTYIKTDSSFTESHIPSLLNTDTTTEYTDINILILKLLDCWISNKMTAHKKETVLNEMKKKHKTIITTLGEDVIKKAIANYAEIINSDKYWFTYQWTIWDFISRGIYKFIDEAKPFDNYIKEEFRRVKNKSYEDEYLKKNSDMLDNL